MLIVICIGMLVGVVADGEAMFIGAIGLVGISVGAGLADAAGLGKAVVADDGVGAGFMLMRGIGAMLMPGIGAMLERGVGFIVIPGIGAIVGAA
jgi:hypothetical protein